MKKILFGFLLASSAAQADMITDTIRLIGTIDKSGCNASAPLYTGLEKPEVNKGLRKVGEIKATIECFGSSKMNMFLVTANRDSNVYFRDGIMGKEISAISPMKFSGEFETEVTIDVLLHKQAKEYDTTVRLVLEAQ